MYQINYRRKTQDGSPIYVGSHIVGRVYGEEFIKSVKGSKHFLHTPPAIAFDVSSLDDAEHLGANWVKVVDTETGTTYRAPISQIRKKGFGFNRGSGYQIALPLNEWIIRRAGEMEQQLLFQWG